MKERNIIKKITPNVSNENDLNNIKAYYETLWAYQLIKQYDIEYIKNNPVTIDYSETNPTNQNVTATLRTNAQITINNNSNSKVYTFTQNGTFTFDYTIKKRTNIPTNSNSKQHRQNSTNNRRSRKWQAIPIRSNAKGK